MGELFCLPTIAAGVLGLTELDGILLEPSTLILPSLCVLPMGWSWSVLFCQSVVEKAIEDALSSVSSCGDGDGCGSETGLPEDSALDGFVTSLPVSN